VKPRAILGDHADVAQLARASACHAEGRGFESLHPLLKDLQICRFGCLDDKHPMVRGKVRACCGRAMTLRRLDFGKGSRDIAGGSRAHESPANQPNRSLIGLGEWTPRRQSSILTAASRFRRLQKVICARRRSPRVGPAERHSDSNCVTARAVTAGCGFRRGFRRRGMRARRRSTSSSLRRARVTG
jgi:hypothetical protein